MRVSVGSLKCQIISGLLGVVSLTICAEGEPAITLPELVISADTFPPLRSAELTGERLRDAPERSLDAILRQIPGFSLFRRSDSVTSHPTSQGVSLGNTGPNGASRSAVFLDGIPMNDPFGGWIPWTRLPVASLAKVTLTPNGNPDFPVPGPLCGSVNLQSRFLVDAPFTLTEVSAGNRLDHQFSLATAQDVEDGRIRLFGGVQDTDFNGYRVIRADRSGSVDIPAWCRAQSFDVGVRQLFSPTGDWNLTLRAQGWREVRGNGTPLAQNQSDALDFSARLEHQNGPGEWSGDWTLFHQRRDFSSTFTSVAANRASESLTLDQFGVPSVATGILQRLRLPLGESHTLALGADLRSVEGTTYEHFRNLGAGFTRGREAGGHQLDAGLSLADTWAPRSEFSLTPSLRLGLHQDTAGRLRESDLATGAEVTRADYASSRRTPVDLGLSARWKPHPSLETEASVFSCHREPTLNELYRPYRVGNTVTLANPTLRPEALRGTEAALRWHPSGRVTFLGRVFYNELQNAVANVSLVRGPGNFPDWGVLPAGGVGARRENLDLIRIRGFETGVELTLPASMSMEVRWLHSEACVRHASIQPALEGLVPAQMPQDSATVTVRGAFEKWRWNIAARYSGGQFDDDQNQRRLASYVCVDMMLTRTIWRGCEGFLGVENLGNTEIQMRKDADGTVGITTPLSWTAGVRWEF